MPGWRRSRRWTTHCPRHAAVAAYLHERDGDLATAARLYAEAAHKAPTLAERDHLTRQAARSTPTGVADGSRSDLPAALGVAACGQRGRWIVRGPRSSRSSPGFVAACVLLEPARRRDCVRSLHEGGHTLVVFDLDQIDSIGR